MGSTAKTERKRSKAAAGERDQGKKGQGRPCPMCSQPTPPRESNRAHPFCSPRCQLADLGRWLDEDYRL